MVSETGGSFSDLDPRTVLKEVGLAGLVALGLSFALVGLRTIDAPVGSGASGTLIEGSSSRLAYSVSEKTRLFVAR